MEQLEFSGTNITVYNAYYGIVFNKISRVNSVPRNKHMYPKYLSVEYSEVEIFQRRLVIDFSGIKS